MNKDFDDAMNVLFGRNVSSQEADEASFDEAMDDIMSVLDENGLITADLSTVELDEMLEAILQDEQPIDPDAAITVSLAVDYDGYGPIADGTNITEFDASEMHIKEVLRKFQDFILGPMGFVVNGDPRLVFIDDNTGQVVWRATEV
jgi:hypothetical protein